MTTTRIFPVLLLALAACTPRTKPAPQALPKPPPPAEAPTLGGLLARELNTRPTANPAVEQVAAALQHAGFPLPPMKQVLARTVGARYCAASTTPTGLAIAVCEFASDADADRGLAYSHRTFDALIPGRILARNRAALLTLTPGAPNPDAHAQAERVAATFATL